MRPAGSPAGRTAFAVAASLSMMAACAGSEGSVAGCGAPTLTGSVDAPLPEAIVAVRGVRYHAVDRRDAFDVVEGVSADSLPAVHERYKTALRAAGADITFDEGEADDAEVAYQLAGRTGFVQLEEKCEGRTTVRISVRSAVAETPTSSSGPVAP